MTHPTFHRYIGIDYSGAETPDSSLKGLRVYEADLESVPVEVEPPPSPRKYWTRRGLAEWLAAQLSEDMPTLVGIDHGFSFPLRYFEVHHLKPDWPTFFDDFHQHWPTDAEHTYVDFVRDGLRGYGEAQTWINSTVRSCPGTDGSSAVNTGFSSRLSRLVRMPELKEFTRAQSMRKTIRGLTLMWVDLLIKKIRFTSPRSKNDVHAFSGALCKSI